MDKSSYGTGRGTFGWTEEEEETKQVDIVRGDIYSVRSGSVFYVRSQPDPTSEKLRIYAIFNGTSEFSQGTGAYSPIYDLVLGFDQKILQMAFKVSEEVIEEIASAEKPPLIVHLAPKNETDVFDWGKGIIEAVIRGASSYGDNKSKKKTKKFNIFKRKPDFENCYGWSLAVDSKNFGPLKDSNIGVFLVNLTKGSMMGPHWNPRATEVAVVIHGQGIVTIVCSSAFSECKNSSFRVKEGDVFVVPRFHPMAQISFNNDSLVFMGFSTMAKNNYPQYLAGKSSVLQIIDREILATSFNVSNATINELLAAQTDSIILDCTSCAEEEERRIEDEIEKQKQEEEEREREEEEARKREEEEARRRQEEEEAREREEEEAQRKEEEARRKEEEAKRRQEEEEAKKREEEEAQRKEEEARRKEEEAQRQKEEEEEARQKEKEEEARRHEEEEEAQRQKEEEEEARRRGEEEAQRQREEAQRREEEEAARRREEEEAQRQREEAQRREEEEEAQRQREEAQRREEEEARRREEEAQREHEEAQRKEEEESRRKEEEAEAQRKREEEQRKEEEEEARRREEEEGQRHQGEGEEEGEGRRFLRKM